MLDGNEFIFQLLRFVFGPSQQFVHPAAEVEAIGSAACAGDARQLFQFPLSAYRDGVERNARLVEDSRRQPLFLIEKRQQQVLNVDLLVVEANSEFLRCLQGLLGFFRIAIDVHLCRLPLFFEFSGKRRASVVPSDWRTERREPPG